MKIIRLLFFSTSLLLFLNACHERERIDARIKVDAETNAITPLNQEACFYLAYENLVTQKPQETQDLLHKIEEFPEPINREIKEFIQESKKTLLALSFLEQKNYLEALQQMEALQKVIALPANTTTPYNDEIFYRTNQIERIRSASIQLRKSLPALKQYLSLKKNNTLSKAKYKELKKEWHVNLIHQRPRAIKRIDFPFPQY